MKIIDAQVHIWSQTVTPPSGGTHDPSDPADVQYIGVKPNVTASPKVIDGVIQP